jgi:hypothetical protein
MKTTLIRIATLVTLCFLLHAAAPAQDKIKLSVSFVNSEFKLNPLESVENLQGISVDADARIFSKSNFRLGGVFNYQRVGLDNSLTDPIDTYMAGLQFSYRAGPIEPFAGALFGVQTSYSGPGDKTYARKYRLGVDLPFHKESSFFIRPFFVEFKRTEGLFSPAETSYGAGAGFRF